MRIIRSGGDEALAPRATPGAVGLPASYPSELTTLMQIIAAALAGGVFATIAAAGTLVLHRSWISRIVSFAVGALLGAVFLELLPHALETGNAERVMATVLGGLLAFFALEKLVLWRHAHGHDEHEDEADESEHAHALHAHGMDQGRSGLMILIGTSVHNFCDGVVIAASFLAGPALGVATTVAIVAHAVPQQVGDFAVLVHSGYARSRAFAYNVSVGVATLVGALAGYVALADLQQALPTALAIAASSLLYVAVADLIPSLHRRPEPLETAKQLLLIGLGISVIALAHAWLEP
jgi:zinc and cadmium transporter